VGSQMETKTSSAQMWIHDFLEKNASEQLKLIINNQEIRLEENPKFLGVNLGTRLNFSTHINKVVEKCINRMGLLKALSFAHFKLPFWVLRSLYKSLIRSLMEYNSFIVDTVSNKNMRNCRSIKKNVYG
jgi:hypothetical protein